MSSIVSRVLGRAHAAPPEHKHDGCCGGQHAKAESHCCGGREHAERRAGAQEHQHDCCGGHGQRT